MEVENGVDKEYYILIKKVFKWVILSVLLAILIGIVVGLYNRILTAANTFRKEHDLLILLLPIAGVIITFMYLRTKKMLIQEKTY